MVNAMTAIERHGILSASQYVSRLLASHRSTLPYCPSFFVMQVNVRRSLSLMYVFALLRRVWCGDYAPGHCAESAIYTTDSGLVPWC